MHKSWTTGNDPFANERNLLRRDYFRRHRFCPRLLPATKWPRSPGKFQFGRLAQKYIVQQIADFRNGRRKNLDPPLKLVAATAALAAKASDAELRSAAEYFSGLKPVPWIRVVETKTVPRTHVADGCWCPQTPAAQPIGQRIIETPTNLEQTELRNARSVDSGSRIWFSG